MSVKIKNKDTLFNSNFMKIFEYTIEQNVDNKMIEYKRQLMYRGNAVFVIPYDEVKNSVIMIKQSRIGAIVDNISPYTLEFPAGIIDEGEEAIESAKRELKEETGLDTIAIEQIYKAPIYTTIGGSNETITYFLAKVDSSKVLKNGGETGENEYITTEEIAVETLFKSVLEKQEINNAATLISIFLLKEKLQ